jgi:hypothetical protein
MLERAIELFGSLVPCRIVPPPGFPPVEDSRLGFDATATIVERFSSRGNPHNRYGLFSTNSYKTALHSFDELCFALRRLCADLSAIANEGRPLKEILVEEPRYQISKERTFKLEVVKRMNFSFYPEVALDYGKFDFPQLPGFSNSPLHLLVKEESEEADKAIRWFLDNVFVPKSVRFELEEHLKKPLKRL